MPDILLSIIGTDGVSAPLRAGAEAFKFISDAAKECVHQFEAQEKADRQLRREAGELTDVFKKQASAMQEQLGVSDDMVEKMQTMLLRFGEAPDQVEATTRALLDYSAATGHDALEATSTLLRSVESGRTAFKELGLVYDKTGRASADLGEVTKALAGKLGGAAAAEAGTLEGNARQAKEAFGELQEAVGGFIVSLLPAAHAISTTAQAIRDLQELIFGDQEAKYAEKARKETQALVYQAEAFKNVKFAQEQLDAAMKAPSTGPDQIVILSDNLKAAKRYADEATAAIHALEAGSAALPGLKGPDRQTIKGRASEDQELKEQAKLDAEHLTMLVDFDKAKLDETEKANKAEQDKYAEELSFSIEYDLKDQARREKAAADKALQNRKDDEEEDKRWEAKQKKMMKDFDANQKELDREAKMINDAHQKLKTQMQEMGLQIGQAFVSALTQVMQQAMDGTETDFLGVAADLAFSVGSIVAAGFSTAYPVLGPAIAMGLSAVGSLVHTARAKSWREEQAARKSKQHDGGWIERAHDGREFGMSSDEEMIIAQAGERMLSRSEVARMGGQQGVDQAARGSGSRGGGLHVTVVAQDSNSVREFFEDRGGRGIFNALRTGRGSLTPLFGR